MIYNEESLFEKDLIKLLTTECSWEPQILEHPTEEDLIKNWKNILFNNNQQIDSLNGYPLTDGEMAQIMTQINTLRTPVALNSFINGKYISIVRDNPNDTLHFGKSVSLKIYDRDEIAGGKSRYQIAHQPIFKTNNTVYPDRRGDLMLLINGMPVFHIELKKSGVDISHAEVQIEKYMVNGCFSGIFSLIQIFVAMNPDDAVYFANPGPNGKFDKEYFFHWENFSNEIVHDYADFTRKLLSIPMAHEMIGFYTIADKTDGILKVLRSYQFYAASEISKVVAKTNWTVSEQHGGYVWHTTGSGKTMTSFKAAQLIANSNDADKVVFLIDRTELGTQSFENYRNFANSDEEIQETENTDDLITKLKSTNPGDTLIVTSIQKMSRIKDENGVKIADLEKIKAKRLVFIADECHRDQSGDMHQDIKRTFPNAIYFGFTGTPDHNNTATLFGDELHRYALPDGIRDKNVLPFDPNPISTFNDDDLKTQVALEKVHCSSIAEVNSKGGKVKDTFYNLMSSLSMLDVEKEIPKAQYETDVHRNAVVDEIIKKWDIRSYGGMFHAIFATSSIPEAIEYYRLFKSKNTNLKIVALFDPSDSDNTSVSIEKMEGVTEMLTDYKNTYGAEYNVGTYSKYKKEICAKLAHKKPFQRITDDKKIDIVIVVDQLLTGFDSKWVNTLYLDKTLQGMGFIQAISRTNRLFGPEKPHGSIFWYRYPYTMKRNLDEAVEAYSGTCKFGIFVDKLQKNIESMNFYFNEIKDMFASVGIPDFSKNDSDKSWQRKFATTFVNLNNRLNSAKMQGFIWNKLIYDFPQQDGSVINVELDFNEKTYLILVKRYQELFVRAPGGNIEPLPFNIDTDINRIPTADIDDDYINRNFTIYRKQLDCGNEEARNDALKDLHKSFASLSQEEQRIAKIILSDIESGNVIIEEGKTFRDLLTEYQIQIHNSQIHQLAIGMGLNEEMLTELINLHPNEYDINNFNRFNNLKDTWDIDKVIKFISMRKGEEVSKRIAAMEADKELRKFIISGGYNLTEDK